MKPKTEIKNVNEFLDQLVEEYVEVIMDQTKMLITNEVEEKYEICAEIKEYMNNLSVNVATTIADMSGVDYDLSIKRLEQNQKYIYTNLKYEFGK